MAHGHRPADVWGYSLRAIQVYVELVLKRVRQELHAITVAMRHSQGTDNKVFREFLNSLQGDE